MTIKIGDHIRIEGWCTCNERIYCWHGPKTKSPFVYFGTEGFYCRTIPIMSGWPILTRSDADVHL